MIRLVSAVLSQYDLFFEQMLLISQLLLRLWFSSGCFNGGRLFVPPYAARGSVPCLTTADSHATPCPTGRWCSTQWSYPQWLSNSSNVQVQKWTFCVGKPHTPVPASVYAYVPVVVTNRLSCVNSRNVHCGKHDSRVVEAAAEQSIGA